MRRRLSVLNLLHQIRNNIGFAAAVADRTMRIQGSIRADDVTVQAMRDKGLDTENRKLRADFTRRILVSLHDLMKAGTVQKIGHGRGVRWRTVSPDGEADICQSDGLG
jgi:hypothetical protein